jgi:hypothetical protein
MKFCAGQLGFEWSATARPPAVSEPAKDPRRAKA